MVLVVAHTPGVVPTVLFRLIAGFVPATTSSWTGTTTRSVPLPGPGSGSLLVTHRFAV